MSSGSSSGPPKGGNVPKPRGTGSSLSDAVVAALAKVEDGKPAKVSASEPVAAEAGCAATAAASSGAPPAVGPPVVGGAGTNGASFRTGPGSFSDLMRRWAGGAPMASSPAPMLTPGLTPGPAASPGKESVPPAKVVSEPPVRPASDQAGSKPPPRVSAEPAEVKTEAKAELAEAKSSEPPRVDSDPPTQVDEGRDSVPVQLSEPIEAIDLGDEDDETELATAIDLGPVEVHYFGRTDVGLIREHNEDNFLVADLAAEIRNNPEPRTADVPTAGLIFAVCDGMGGAAAGEVASQMAVDTIHEVMAADGPAEDRDSFARRLVSSIEEAGHRIFSAAKMDRTRRGMGTTSTLAGLVDNTLFVGQVGDSRAYVLRGDQFEMITKDQSLVNQLIEAGQLTEDEAEAFEHSNIILQALGTTEEVTVDLTFLEVREGDRLMMCSDGLSGLVHADMMKEVLQTTKDQVEASAKLTQMANAGGGHDNITIVIADFSGEGLAPPEDASVVYQQYPLPPDEKKRGKSVPPRDASMKKSGAKKPGADVKHGTAMAAGEDVAMPREGGSNAWMGIVAVVVLLLVIVGGWYFTMGPGAAPSGDSQEATSSNNDTSTTPEPVPTNPEEPGTAPTDVALPEDSVDVGDPAADDAIPAEIGTVIVRTNAERGTLYVNGEAQRVPLADGMRVRLAAPNSYQFRAMNGEELIAEQTVVLEVDQTAQVTLNLVEAEDPPEVESPRRTPQSPRRTPREPRERHPRPTNTNDPPPNPFAG